MRNKLKNFFDSLFFHPNFYKIWSVILLLIFIGYWFPVFYVIGKFAFMIFTALTLADFIFLFRAGKVTAERKLPEKLSNGDPNNIPVILQNYYSLPVHVNVIDELPEQFQKRDFELSVIIKPRSLKQLHYTLYPVVRGVYRFGQLNLFVSSPLQLAKIRFRYAGDKQVKVYPSFVQMRKYELMALSNKYRFGIKRVRRLGHTLEFEQIKEYNKGDDYRTINWKATAKYNKLMVNQYQDEKSQNIYSVIDMGRHMQLPFNAMTLLDYAINATLAFSNIAMKKKDKAGLITFEKQIHSFLKPDNGRQHLQDIFEMLYAQHTRFNETDYERLYTWIRHQIPTRSLLMIYTNFEHINSMRRQLPFLIKLAKKHLVVVVVFENTELKKVITKSAGESLELYHKIIAEDFDWQKRMMIKELRLHNIQTIFTAPENLTSATINKYLQLKAQGLI